MTIAGQRTWTSVDEYFDAALLDTDPVMAEIERAGEQAGLPAISVSPAQGKFLHLLIRGARAQRILEVGTLGGHSAV